jgi:hypothetical protein
MTLTIDTTTTTAATEKASLATAVALAALTAVLAPGPAYPVAVPSASSPLGLHHVAVVAGLVSSCDCKGWHYRRACRHAVIVTEQIAAVTAAVHAAAALLDARAAVTFPDADL